MKKKCCKCSTVDEVNSYGECSRCEQRRRDDDDETSRRNLNMMTGDMLNTGLPGGIDLDMTTPW